MRHPKRIAVYTILLAALCMLASGCGKAPDTQQNQGNMPDVMSGTQGVITEITDKSVTIAVMPQSRNGGNRDNGNRPPDGSAQPDASGAPQQPGTTGGAPQGGQPSGQPDGQNAQAMPTFDTSSWEKKTYTIDSQTKIVQGRFRNSDNSNSKALTAADLKAGDSVSIETRSGQDSVAGTITVMTGMTGGGPGRGGPQGSAPAATAKS